MYLDPDFGGLAPSPVFDSVTTARRDLSRIIERALEALDDLEGDPDLEMDAGDECEPAGDEEPSLGWCRHERGIAFNGTDDLEEGCV